MGDSSQTTRTLLTEIWYPEKRSGVNQSATRATFDDYTLGDQQACIASYFYFTADSVDPSRLPVGVTAEAAAQQAKENLCNKKPRNSFKLNKFGKIPTADPTGAPYPVVIILHGATIPRAINGSMAENLVRQGYIVITPDHTGSVQVTMAGSPLDDTPEGVQNRANIQFLPGGLYPARYNVFEFDFTPEKVLRFADAVEQRFLDVKAVLKELHDINNGLSHTETHLQGKMDLGHIGLVGLSLGSVVAQIAQATISEIDAYVVTGAVGLPEVRPLLPPAMLIQRPQNDPLLPPDPNQIPAHLQPTTVPFLYMVSGEDEVIAPFALYFGILGLAPFPAPDNFFPSVRQLFEAAKGPAIFTKLANIQHASYHDVEAFYFPELYKTEFPSILNFLGENRTYTLLDNNVIHSIRNILLPAFFDRYLKGRQGALLPFKFAVFFAKLGLEVESRNLNCRSSC